MRFPFRGRGGPADSASSDEARDVAAVAQRLAVLLGAGVAPDRAWRYLPRSPTVDAVCDRLQEGATVVEALDALHLPIAGAFAPDLRRRTPAASRTGDDSAPWRSMAAAWAVATEAGAPMGAALSRFAASMRDVAQAEREISVALAGPIATARLVAWLPAVALGFGALLGFDTIGVLLGSVSGWFCLIAGVALVMAGRRWTAALARAARPSREVAGLAFELVAMSLAGGGAVDRARTRALQALRTRSLLQTDGGGAPPLEDADGVSGSAADASPDDAVIARVDAVLDLSRHAGVPAAALLRSEAEEARLEATATAKREAARLGVRLMVPLAVCTLPAFMLLGVAPLLISVIGSTVIT